MQTSLTLFDEYKKQKKKEKHKETPSLKVPKQKKIVSGGIKIPKRKNTGEKHLFLEKRNDALSEVEESHILRYVECEVCALRVDEPLTRCFAHLLPKGTYPKYRLMKENIAIVCVA